MLFRPSEGKRNIGVVLGFLIVAFFFAAYIRFDLAAMFHDLQMAAASRSHDASQSDRTLWPVFEKTNLLLVLLLAVLNYLDEKVHGPSRMGTLLVLVGCMVFGADVLIRATNHQTRTLPLTAVFALILANCFTARRRRIPWPAARASVAGFVAVLVLASMLFLPLFASDMTGIAYGALQKARPSHPEEAGRFTEPRLAPLLLYDNDLSGLASSNGRPYTNAVNDGIALLRKFSPANETIFTFDMSNPFPYALGRKPPAGASLGLTWGKLQDKYTPSADAFFGQADIVMVPKHPGQIGEYFDVPYRVYEPALQQRFSLVAESDWWLLYRRRK
jgi:hypothetical protein